MHRTHVRSPVHCASETETEIKQTHWGIGAPPPPPPVVARRRIV